MRENPIASRAVSAYQQASTTVPPLSAVVMLYDKAIVQLQRASLAAEQGQPAASFGHVSQATTILQGLSHALNFERGGAVAEHLRRMYTQMTFAMMRAYGRPEMPDLYRKLAVALTETRNAWAGVAGVPTVGASVGARPPSR